MAPTSGVKSRQNEIMSDDANLYKAVVLADCFSEKCLPLTKKIPSVLMPVVNTAVIDYTLNCLLSSGIKLVYLFCSRNSEKISDYINTSQWSKPEPEKPMHISIIVSKTCLSVGDALRELDSRGIVRNDFVLLNGETVANVNLKPIIDNHRERYKQDKRLVMTMLFRRAYPGHRTRSAAEEAVIITDNEMKRILHYQNVRSSKKISVPLELFKETKTVSIRHDLLDCQVAICSPQVLHLFSDNFDFQTREDFIKGILVEEEILGNILTFHELESEYAARISNLHMYDAMSKDIINRWTYPFVPDIGLQNKSNNVSSTPYSYLRNNVYLQKEVTLGRSCALKENVVVGAGTKIGDNSNIVNSVVGNNCVIGNNVKLENAYLWDNVAIQDGCCVTSSILATGVKLLKNVKVSVGCVLSNNVVIGPSVTLPQGIRLTAEEFTEDDEFDEGPPKRKKQGKIDKNLIGAQGKGYVFHGGEQESKDFVCHMLGLHALSEDEEASGSEPSEAGEDSDDEPHLVDDSKLFYKEVVDSLSRAVDEKISWENLVLEINSSKYAYNVSMQEVNMLVTTAIVNLPLTKSKEEVEPTEYFKILKPILVQFVPVLKNYMKSVESQSDCLNSLEEHCDSTTYFTPCLMKVLQILYDQDVVSEEAIFRWYNLPAPEENGDDHVNLRKQVSRFIVWLQEAEEESDE